MSSAEGERGDRPQFPTTLPPELAAYLKEQEYACVTEATDYGTVFIIKVPAPEIESVRGLVPVLLQQSLYQHPAAPIIQLVVSFFDQPATPLILETYINVTDPQQHAHYAALTTQPYLPMLFYDEAIEHQLTKVIGYHQQPETTAILTMAEHIASTIPREQFNFDLAKAALLQATRW